MKMKSMMLFCFLLLFTVGYGQNTNPFTMDISGDLSNLKFRYLTVDLEIDGLSAISKLATYYVDPVTEQEVMLFQSDFDGQFPYTMENDAEVTWGEPQEDGNMIYLENTWNYPKNLEVETLEFHMYVTWFLNQGEDNTTYNPMVVTYTLPKLSVELYHDGNVFAGNEFSIQGNANYPVDSWTWEIEGQEPVTGEMPFLSVNTPGTYDLKLTLSSNGISKEFNYPDYIVVVDIPVSPFTFVSRNNDTKITFKYLVFDESTEGEFSSLDHISTYYLDPVTQEEVFLFSSSFDNQSAYSQENGDDISWDDTLQEGNLWYQENSWTYPQDLNAENITFHVYASWNISGYFDETSANPMVVQQSMQNINVSITALGKIYAGMPFTLQANSESEIESWTWEIEGFEPVNLQNPNFTINTPGSYDATLTVSSNGIQKTFNYPDLIAVSAIPTPSFNVEVSEKNDQISFSYLIADRSVSSDYSALSEIKTYYIDPATNTPVFLFSGKFDNLEPVDKKSGSEISWDGSQTLGNFSYYKNTYSYPKTFHENALVFYFYVTWDFKGIKDSVSINPRIIQQSVPQLSVELLPQGKVYAGIPSSLNVVSDDAISSWKWEIEGQQAMNQQNPEFTISAAGSYDATLTVSSNGTTRIFNYPDLITVLPVPATPFTMEISEKSDVLKFRYLLADQSQDDLSVLEKISVYYVDPVTNKDVQLFASSFDGLNPSGKVSGDKLSWDGNQQAGQLQYYENSYQYPTDIKANSLSFKVYATWNFNGLKDSLSVNPQLIKQTIPQFNIEVLPLGKIYSGIPFTLKASSENTIDSWKWEIKGQQAVSEQNASFTLTKTGAYDATLTVISNGNTRIFDYPGLITVRSIPTMPFSVMTSETNDVISIQYLIADKSSSDDLSVLSKISAYYVDPATSKEVFLFSSSFDGQTPTSKESISDVSWVGVQTSSSNVFYKNSWKYPITLTATSLSIRIYATWNFNGLLNASSFNPVVVTQKIPQVSVKLSSLGNVYTGIPAKLTATTTSSVSSWKWEVEGQSASSIQSPTFTFTKAGSYDAKLTVVSNGHTRELNYQDLFKVAVAPTLKLVSDFPQNVAPNVSFSSKLSATGAIGTVSYSATGLPSGAVLNSTSGLFTWTKPVSGTYQFSVKLKDSSREVTQQFSFTVSPTNANITFNVTSSLGDKLKDAFVYIKMKDKNTFVLMQTNADGKAVVVGSESLKAELQTNTYYSVSVAYSDWPAYKTTLKFSKDSTCAIVLNATSLVLQDVILTADKITKSSGKYTLTGNVSINDLMFFEGSKTVLVDNTKDNMPIITTENNVRIKGGKINKELLAAGYKKEFYLYQGMLIPTNRNVSFSIGDICKIPMRGYVLSFYDDGVEFATFPKLPWIIGDFVTDAGYFFVDKMISLIRAGNLDFGTTMKVSGLVYDEVNAIMDSIQAKKETPKDPVTTTPETTKAKGRIGKLFDKFEGLSISFPSIEVVKYLDVNVGETQDVSIEDLAVCKNGIGLSGFTAKYDGREDYFDCSAQLVWGGDCEGDDRSSGTSFSEMRSSLVESFDEFKDMDQVVVEVQNECGTVIYKSSYDEFVDITGELALKELDERKLPISGFGVEFAIKAGKIDKIIISVDVAIPITSTPFQITKITGGVDKLTKTVNGVTTYSTQNMVVILNCDIEDMSPKGLLAFRKVGLTVQPFSYFGGSGSLEIADKEIAYGSLSYDNNANKFNTYADIDVMDMFKGKGSITITGSSMSGVFNLNTKLPSSLPAPFGWASNMSLGSRAVVFSDKMVGAKVSIGKEITTYETVEVRGWGKKIGKGLKSAVKSTANAVVSSVKYVTNKVVTLLSFEVGVGYDFANKKLLFGENVKIPSISRMCYRGDTLIQEFNITEDTRLMYLTVSNGGADFVDFDLYDNNQKLVGEEAVWCQDSTNNEVIVVVPQPGIGTWTVKVDTTLFRNVTISPMYFDNVPQGVFVSPATVDTLETEIMVKFNDTNDTLAVSIFVDDDLEEFNGTPIADFKIMNNANIKFTYKPTNLKPGNYYFYYRLSDGSNIPSYQYAAGSLVIPSGKIAAPTGVKNEVNENNLTIYWDAPDSTEVDYVNIELLDQFTGIKSVYDIPADTFMVIDSLKFSRNYTYSVQNMNFSGSISNAVQGKIFMLAASGNNVPVWNMKNDQIYEVFETDTLKLNIDVSDPDGDALSLKMIGALPKEMFLTNGMLQWNTDVDDRGIYNFSVVANDGTVQDTLQLRVLVKPVQETEVQLSFASGKLYEQDNMFLTLNDPRSTEMNKTAWLFNITKKDSVKVDMVKVNSSSYQGYFQLSYQRRSILPVSEGDTLIAVYASPIDTVYAFAVFDSIPQISDNIAPSAVTDLEATLIGDQVQIVFTVPEDRMDNNMMTNPWSYDLRYAYQSLDNETTYLGAHTIEGLSVGAIGTRDTVMVSLADLFDQDKYHRVWFNVKAGDTKFNFAEMSNTAYVDYVSAPQNLVAEIQDDYSVELNWNGPEKLLEDNYFEHYEVYRKINEGEYFLIGHSESNTYLDVPGAEVEDGIFSYVIRGIYFEAKTEPVVSNEVDFNRYSDIKVVCLDNRETKSGVTQFDVKVTPIDGSETITVPTDAEGIAYFSGLENGKYEVFITIGDDIYLRDYITVRPDSTNFEFTISGTITAISSLLQEGEIHLYPNPVKDQMTINLNDFAGNVTTITILNMDGKLIQTIVPGDQQLILVDATRFSRGVYIANFVMSNRVIAKLFIVE